MSSPAKPEGGGDKPAAPQKSRRGGMGVVSQDVQGETGAPDRHAEPKLPHERDQTTGPQSTGDASTANAAAPGDDTMRRAHDDVVSGKQDTDRGPVMDSTYHALRKNKKPQP